MKLKELERRLSAEPDNLGLKVTVAGLLHDAGRTVEAVELYRTVAVAYRDGGRKQQAIAVCRSILELAPTDGACRALLAELSGPEPAEAVERRSSIDETPLPKAVPYHVVDPTTGAQKVSASELGDVEPTRPDPAPATPSHSDEDLAAELETRPRRKIDSAQLRKLATLDTDEDVDDDVTPVRDSQEITRPVDKLPEKD